MESLATVSEAEASGQRRNLSLVLGWLTSVGVLSVLAYTIVWFVTSSRMMGLMAISTVALTLSIGSAWLLARRGATQAALVTGGSTFTIAALLYVTIAPVMLPIMTLLPVIAVAMVLPFISLKVLPHLLTIAIVVSVVLPWLSRLSLFGDDLPPVVGALLVPLLVPAITAAALLLIWQFHRRLSGAHASLTQAHRDLQLAQAGLEEQVVARTAELRTALGEIESRAAQQEALLDEVAQQRAAIRELSVPVLPVARGTLVLPLVGAIDSARIAQLQEQALSALERAQARRLLIDVTGVPVIDTQVAQGLVQVMQASRLLGAEAVLVGIRPEVAQTLVSLDVDLSRLHTYADLETALSKER